MSQAICLTATCCGGKIAMNRQQIHLMVAYDAAMKALSPLPRAVFLLHRLDDLPYREIGARLSITASVVEASFVRALAYIALMMEGQRPSGLEPPLIADAEAILHKQYLGYRARRAWHLALNLPEPGKRQDRSEPAQRWPLVVRRCLTFAGASKKQPSVPPAMSFDEWLRKREGPNSP
jgi:hypothetical protein